MIGSARSVARHTRSGSSRRTAERSSAGNPSDAKAEARATHQRESSADKDKYHQRRLRPDVFATSGACVQMLFATSGACVQMLYNLTTMRQVPIEFFSIQKTPTTSDACVQKLSGEHYLFFSMQLNRRRLNWLSQGRDVQAPGRSPELLKDSSGLRGVEESTEGKHSISPQGVEDKPFSRKTRQNMNEEDCFAAGQQARGISQLTTPAQIGEVGKRSCSAV